PESKLIEAIANGVLKRLDATFQSENKGLVGVAWRIKEIESLLCIRSAGVYVLGIWGIGGIGKTTIAGTGTEAIKGISLDMNKVNRKIHMDSFAFSKMPKLRFLKFYGFENKCMVSHLDGVLFAELRHLEWQQYPLKTLNIHAENLVSLKMPFSKVEQLWDDVQRFLEIPSCNTDGSTGIERLGSCKLVLKECSNIESLPSSLCMFKSLTSLEIVDCQNFKRLPDELGNLEALKTLTVDGTAIREVPKSLGQLPLLYSLQLKKCSELEYISSNIFKLKSDMLIEISNCSNLKRFLEIPSCNTDGSTGIERLGSCELVLKECSNIECLPSSMCMFKSLTSLEIVDCQNFKRLPDELGNFEALSTLTIDGAVIREVPESLGRLPLLYSLQLKKCSELEYISSSIFKLKSDIEISNCSNLKRFLEIPSCNTDGSTGIEWLGSYELRLPDELGNLEALRMLTVDGTTIREVPESLGQLPLLYSLQLKNCSELEYISSSIFKMKSLESIEISNCSNLKSFLENPSCNTDGGTRIEKLASSRLKLEGCSSLESLPSSLCMFKNLTSLEIIDCQNFKRLPNELGNSKCLTVLIVKGTAIREVPESLGQLSSLESLVLSNNNLERLPESLNQLSSLEYLQLFENSLEGIPEYLRSLPSKLTSHNLSVDLRNCLKLDLNELSEIVKDQWMKQSFDVNFGTTKSMYFPGNEIPKWFRYQSMGSSVTFKTPPTDFFQIKY
ncbi:hypothetical protein CUMW_276360, partial [Citrus unshiu]